MKIHRIFSASLFCFAALAGFSTAAEINGSISLQSLLDFEDAESSRIGFRYLPEIYGSLCPNVDAMVSVELDASGSDIREFSDDLDLELYRFWVRYARPNWELRAGLQKINFGPARLLRSMMWFENMDVRDPLKIAGGVKGVLGRYYFKNNANVWLWGLWGNNDRKGLEIFKTKKDSFEAGGRLQFPVPAGEAAVSYHRRQLSYSDGACIVPSITGAGRENRFGLDASFDIGPGVWFEMTFADVDFPGYRNWDKYFTAGMDYTLDAGLGILISSEYSVSASGRELMDFDDTRTVASISADMSISMLDSLKIYTLYYPQHKQISSYFLVTKLYDNFKIDLGLSFGDVPGEGAYGGNSIMLTVTYNY